MKIRPVGAEVFLGSGRTDGETDVKKLIVAFSNFATAHKKLRNYRFTFVDWDCLTNFHSVK